MQAVEAVTQLGEATRLHLAATPPGPRPRPPDPLLHLRRHLLPPLLPLPRLSKVEPLQISVIGRLWKLRCRSCLAEKCFEWGRRGWCSAEVWEEEEEEEVKEGVEEEEEEEATAVNLNFKQHVT